MAATDGDPASSIVGTGYTVFGDASGELVSPCVPVDGDSTYTYADTIGANHRPDTCFRVTADGDSNYFDGYTVEVQPTDASVSWGKVDWPDDPFADLECEAVTFSAMDQVDVCEMFEAEVDQALDNGWGGSRGTVKFGLSARVADTSAAKIDHWTVAASPGTPDRFKTLWFDDNLNGKIKKDPTTPGATSNRPDPDGAGTDAAKGDANAMHDLYDDNGDPSQHRSHLAVHPRCRCRSCVWRLRQGGPAGIRPGTATLRGTTRWIRTARRTTTLLTPGVARTSTARAVTRCGPTTTKCCSLMESSAAPRPGW